MDLKSLLRQTQKKADLRREGRNSDDRSSYMITVNGSPLRALMLLPFVLFGLFVAFLSFLPFLVKAMWRVAKVAGRAEQVRSSGQPKQANSRDEDFIDI